MTRRVPLEAAAEEVCNQSAIPPLIFDLPPEQARQRLEDAQSIPVYMYPAKISGKNINTRNWGEIPVYFISPDNNSRTDNIIFYIHGGGWVLGSFHTHEKLVRELAARTNSLIVFPEYTRSPEAKYPIAVEQCYYVLSHIWEITDNRCQPEKPLIIAGDSVGGNMIIAMSLMSKYRKGIKIQKQLLFYPVTDACFNTPTYSEFAEGYYLYRKGMIWFWNQYTTSEKDRNKITASPLRANIDQLNGMPDTLLINGQADVLRSEGQAFGEKLLRAGVNISAIQVQATIHDFVMLNALNQANACRVAMDTAVHWINCKNALMA